MSFDEFEQGYEGKPSAYVVRMAPQHTQVKETKEEAQAEPMFRPI